MVVRDAPPGSNYLWNTGDTTAWCNDNPTVSTSYTVTVTHPNGCQEVFGRGVTVYQPPVYTTITADTTFICQGDTASLTATHFSPVTTFQWNSYNAMYFNGSHCCPMVFPSATTTYSVTASLGSSCIATDSITISVHPFPAPDAGADFHVCSDTAILNATTPSIGVGMWSVVYGTGTIDNPSDPNTTVRILAAGDTTVFRWTVSDSLCSRTDDLAVIRDKHPSFAVTGADQTICSNVLTLTAGPPSIGTGLWTVVSGQSLFIASPSSSHTHAQGLQFGQTYVFEWRVSNGTCPSSIDTLNIQVIILWE